MPVVKQDLRHLGLWLSSCLFSLLGPSPSEASPTPSTVRPESPERVLTLVHGSEDEDLVFIYLEALPGASRSNHGFPVVLAVDSSLEPAAESFLEKYRPTRIRRFGPPHRKFPRARPAREEWPPGGTVIVAPRDLGPATQAAALALRLKAPLVIEDRRLSERLQRLRPTRIVTFGKVKLPTLEAEIQTVSSPVEAAAVAGGAHYLALCNIEEGEGAATAAFASLLAGHRGGVVLPLPLSTERHQIPLQVVDEVPPGFEASSTGGDSHLFAKFKSSDGPLIAGAIQTSVVRVGSHSAPRYGRLRIDLDGDGRLEPEETPRIGSQIEIAGKSYHLIYHYGHPFVRYLDPEIIFEATAPQTIRSSIRDLAQKLGELEYLAIVGTPNRVPFFYREAQGYFEAYDLKQELPSDAPYADLDDDSYLELAVGRLPVEDLFAGSAVLATTIAYPLLTGEWVGKATVIQPGFHKLEGSLPWVLPNAEAMMRGIQGDLEGAGVNAETFYRSDVDIDEVVESMEDAAWIAYFNHSGPGQWGIHPGSSIVAQRATRFRDRSLPDLKGAPIVFGGGCSSAALDVGQPLSATFPGRFFELGAVAYLGNTRVAYARSEHLVQPFFSRLASGESTLGHAYRDGRNFLSHLLRSGHLIGPLDEGIEIGVRDFLWGQYEILNLFGDPALKPRISRRSPPPLEITLRPTEKENVYRLIVENRGEDRRDPILMMPASGQGSPREFFVRTGPGMTSSHVPHHYLDEGLSPIRSIPEIQPGAWVDVPLPESARVDAVSLVEGPDFVDRGFTVVPDARGRSRLLMYVPLVHSTFEKGDGTVVQRVEFDVKFRAADGSSAATHRTDRPRVRTEASWTPRADRQPPRIASSAKSILARVKRRYQRNDKPRGIENSEWILKNPQPRLYGDEARGRGRWNERGDANLTIENLSPTIVPRKTQLEKALQKIAELPFRCPLPSLEGWRVRGSSSKKSLVLTPLVEGEGAERLEIFVARDGTIERTVHRQFDVVLETDYSWRTTPQGIALEQRRQFDRRRSEEEVVHRVEYLRDRELVVPARVTLSMPGILPREFHFEFSYLDQF